MEFVGRVLKVNGFARVTKRSELDRFWIPIIPTTWPVNDDLARRVPVPVFFRNQACCVAVDSAVGDRRIPTTIHDTLLTLGIDAGGLVGLGAVLDADSSQSPIARFNQLRSGLSPQVPGFPAYPGQVSSSRPRSGAFVMPDNASAGTLEDLLLEAARHTLPNLLADAERFIERVDPTGPELSAHDCSDFTKPAGRNKATVACLGNIFKPGKAIQTSIQDDFWVSAATLRIVRLAAFEEFIKSLLAIPSA